MAKSKGRFTLPSEENFTEETKELISRFGADALRDSDGTHLPEELKTLDIDIYTTYFVVRQHNEHALAHLEERQHFYLMSPRVTAFSTELEIRYADEYFSEQVEPDLQHDPKRYWQLIDRSSGETIAPERWHLGADQRVLIFPEATPYHVYTVDFLAYAKWDPTEMYNHLTNNWGDKPHEIPFDVKGKASSQFVEDCLRDWLMANPHTDIVRFTTFFYHFTLLFNRLGKEKYVDWFGYTASVSPEAIDMFEKEYGYRPTAEDFVDEGYYNSPFRVPSRVFLDYMDFTQRFVAAKAKRLVDIVHQAGRKAVMFLGDNWIGTEPYGKYFAGIGLDGVVGSVGDGVTLRLISDIRGVSFTEGRFLPYFFPDTFHAGAHPTEELLRNWRTARRAVFRSPVQRIGYGGYLSLAYKFPDFLEAMEHLADEYREMMTVLSREHAMAKAKVGVLNAWGKIRSWMPWIVSHGLWSKRSYSYMGILEALAGMDVDVSFLSFEDLLAGRAAGLDVIINAGDAGTAWSGGKAWSDPAVQTALRAFVARGGGLIGVGEPSAWHGQGAFFQLSDVFGVDEEEGFSQSSDRYFFTPVAEHFILEGRTAPLDFGETTHNIYALDEQTVILAAGQHELHLTCRDYGQGRAVYMAGLPYSAENATMLRRAIFFAAHRETVLNTYEPMDPRVQAAVFPEQGKVALMNNSADEVHTEYRDGQGQVQEVDLAPSALIWLEERK